MNIDWTELGIPGCYVGKLPKLDDSRGSFRKLYQANALVKVFPDFEIRESYVTVSRQGVLRGMHFQMPPDSHQKLVVCLSGSVRDVVLDLRVGPSYGKVVGVDLSAEHANCILVPVGCAHGFYTYVSDTTLLYLVSTEHSPEKDAGVLWDSIGYNWPLSPGVVPEISKRDERHPALENFNPPADWDR